MALIWKLRLTDGSTATAFAAEEFKRLMARLDPLSSVEDAVDDPDALAIGLDGPLDAPQVADPRYDDGIAIRVKDGKGAITGTNPRSVLMAVYRFFTEAGCEFLRPGLDGEFVPARDSASLEVDLSETPAYRHRGICIEGANSFENVANMVDYLPKVGMNTYFTQFFRPYEFFDRWYRHTDNPFFTPTPVSEATVDSFVKDYSDMLTRRGLIHQGVGHGWTAKCLGLDANGWYMTDNDAVDPERRKLIAEIDGKHNLFAGFTPNEKQGVAINTNLCYSNPEARRLFIDTIVEYCTTHHEMDYVHIWLADAPNNQCECPACQATTPSDLYVDMLNEVDEILTQKGCPTKLVFLLYLELLWPPKTARFKNTSRFTLMFAPITRTYSASYETTATGQMAPFVRNKIDLPRSVGDSLTYLKAWQALFSGDSFVYDYHYMWDHNFDLGDCALSRILVEDIANLKALGLDGLISCQITRCHLPVSLGQNLMGKALWQGKLDYEAAKADFFKAAFGADAPLAQEYLETLSRLCMPEYCRQERPALDPEAAAGFAKIPGVVEAFMPIIERNRKLPDLAQARSWDYLAQQAPLAVLVGRMLYARATGDEPTMKALWEEIKTLANRLEVTAQAVFEAPEFIRTFSRIFRKRVFL